LGEDLYSQQKELYSSYPCMSALSKKNPFAYPVNVSTSAEISRAETESVYAPGGEFFQDGESIFMLTCPLIPGVSEMLHIRGHRGFNS
jgi:hypothetical protein